MTKKPLYFLLLLSVFLVAGLAQPSWAQSTSAELGGQVADSSGAPIVGAKITIRSVAKGTIREITSDETGNFLVTQLAPDMYELDAEAAGFHKLVQKGIQLNVGQSARLNVKLSVGGETTNVEVTADVVALDTTNGALGQVVENRKILDLPLDGRNIVGLAALATGVVPGNGFGGGIPYGRAALNQAAASNISIDGGMTTMNDVLIDGVPLSVCCQNQIAFLPSIDTTEEFRVRTNMYDAQFGRTGGGIITYASKSGSNAFHGSLYEFLRNNVFDANLFFNKRSKTPIGHFVYNQFGGRVGGPILHNRLFFFGNYEGIRNGQTSSLTGYVPTSDQLNGIFTVPIYDPLTGNTGNGYTRTAFANNTIPQGRINAAAQALAKLYPAPNSNVAGYNYTATASSTDREDQFNVRLDYIGFKNHHLFGRYSYNSDSGDIPDWFHDAASPGDFSQEIRNANVILSDTVVFSASFVGTFMYGVTRQGNSRVPRSLGTDLTQYGFPATYSSGRQYATLPLLSITGLLGYSSNSLYIRNADVQTVTANFDRILGRHDLKFGFDGRLYQTYWVNNNTAAGTFSFNTGFTRGPNALTGTNGSALASFLLGYPASGSISVVNPFFAPEIYLGFYLQDDFKVNNKLTVNTGLRWEDDAPRTERYNRLSYFDPKVASPLAGPTGISGLVGGLQFLGVNGNPSDQQNQDLNNFGPRVGFAWQPLPTWVVRGGYGIVFLPITTRYVNNSNQGFSTTTNFLSSTDGGRTPASILSNPFPTGVAQPLGSALGLLSSIGQSFGTLLRNAPNAYAQQWSLSIQRSLGSDVTFEAAYTASKGTKLPMPIAMNTLNSSLLSMGSALLQSVPNPFQSYAASGTLSAATVTQEQLLLPFPQFLGLTNNAAPIGSSSYNAMTLKLQKRFSKGYSVLASFTGGKEITDTTPWNVSYLDSAPGYQDVYNRRADRSVAPEDISRRTVISFVAEIPMGRGHRVLGNVPRAVDVLTGGWQVNGITTYQTGQPIVITNSVSTISGATRPNTTGNWQTSGSEYNRVAQWFNTAAFSAPGQYQFGNTPRTLPNLRAGSTRNYDVSLFKDVTLPKETKVEIRADVFNLFNTPQFAAPNGTYGAAGFGAVTSQLNFARQIQLAARITF